MVVQSLVKGQLSFSHFVLFLEDKLLQGRSHVSSWWWRKQALDNILSVDKYKWTERDLHLQLTAQAGHL